MKFTDLKISLDKSWKFTPQVLILMILGIFVIFGVLILVGQLLKVPPPPLLPSQPELIEVTETSGTYRNPDGTFTKKFYTTPKYYKDNPDDPDEPWKKINTAIVPSAKEGYDWEMTKAPFKVYFKNDLSKNDALIFEQAGISLTFQLTGTKWRSGKEQSDAVAVSEKEARVNDNTISWNGIFNKRFNLKYELGSAYGLKEFWIIDNKEALPAPPSFIKPDDPEAKLDIEFIIKYPDSLKLYTNGEVWNGKPVEIDSMGGLTLRDKNGKEAWNATLPTLIDKGKEKENALFGTYYLSKTPTGDTSLRIALPYRFLANSNYPVVIDPQVNLNPVVGTSSLVLRTRDVEHNHFPIGFFTHNGTYPPRNDINFDFNYDAFWTGNSPPIHVGQSHCNDPFTPGYSTSRGYVDFDTSGLGAGATINSVQMQMQRYGTGSGSWNWVSTNWTLMIRWGFDFSGCFTKSCYWDINPLNYTLVGQYNMPCCALPPANISINLNSASVDPAGHTYYMLTNNREENGWAPSIGSDNPLLDVDYSEVWSSFNPVLVVDYTPVPPPICSTSLVPDTIPEGETATFTWSSTDATSCSMSGDDGWSSSATSGNHTTASTLSEGTYNFGGGCTGPGGNTTCTTRTLTVNPPNNPPIADASVAHTYNNPDPLPAELSDSITITPDQVLISYFATKDNNGDGLGSYDPEGGPDGIVGNEDDITCEWDYDNDGTPDSSACDNWSSFAVILFWWRVGTSPPPGNYTSTLTVTDDQGQTAPDTVTVIKRDFTLQFLEASQSVMQGQQVTYTLQATSQNDYSGDLTFTGSSSPAESSITYDFNPSPVFLSAGGSVNIQMTVSTTDSTPTTNGSPYTIIARSGNPLQRTTTTELEVNPLPPTVDIQGWDPLIGFSDGPVTIDEGQDIILRWTVGRTPDSCTASGDWSGAKDATDGIHSENLGPLSQGSYGFIITCAKAGFLDVSDTVDFTILPSPLSVSCSVDPSDSALIDQEVTWTADASGGTLPYIFTWSGNAVVATCVADPVNQDPNNLVCTYSEDGDKTVAATVDDSAFPPASAGCSIGMVVEQLPEWREILPP